VAEHEFSPADVLHDPDVVDQVAEACISKLPADAVLEVDEIVVTGDTAAVLVAHSIARRLECRVTIAELDAGVLYVTPDLTQGQRVVILEGRGGNAVTLSALRMTVERVANVLTTCSLVGEDVADGAR